MCLWQPGASLLYLRQGGRYPAVVSCATSWRGRRGPSGGCRGAQLRQGGSIRIETALRADGSATAGTVLFLYYSSAFD